MKKYTGFTMIELIVVIVILGILAAYAVPRYMNLDTQARISVINGLSGSVRAAADMVHAIALVQGSTTSVNIGPGNTAPTITLNNGYPDSTNNGIPLAIADYTGFTYNATDKQFTKNGATNSTLCAVNYANATATTPPEIVPVIDGC